MFKILNQHIQSQFKMDLKIFLCFVLSFSIVQAAVDSDDSDKSESNIVMREHKMGVIPVEITEVSHDTIQNAIDATFKHDFEHNSHFESDHKYDSEGEMSCMHFGGRMIAKIVPAFLACAREMNLNRRDLKTKSSLKSSLPCLIKCTASKIGFFNKNGSFDEGYYWKFLHEEVPKKFHKHADTIFNTCQRYVELIDEEEPECQSYKPFFKCVVDTFVQLASEALNLCTDIPEEIRNRASEVIQSKRTKELISHYID